MKSLFSYLEIPIKRKTFRFCDFLKVIFFVMFSDCPYFRNKALDKVYNEQSWPVDFLEPNILPFKRYEF